MKNFIKFFILTGILFSVTVFILPKVNADGLETPQTEVIVTIVGNSHVINCGDKVLLNLSNGFDQEQDYNGSDSYTFWISGQYTGTICTSLQESCQASLIISGQCKTDSWDWHDTIYLTIRVLEVEN